MAIRVWLFVYTDRRPSSMEVCFYSVCSPIRKVTMDLHSSRKGLP
eukprot:bmy_09128T0